MCSWFFLVILCIEGCPECHVVLCDVCYCSVLYCTVLYCPVLHCSILPLCINPFVVKVKVKQSRYRPGVAQRVPGSLRFPDFMTTAQDGGKVVSLMHRPPLPLGNAPGTHFC